MDIALNMNKFLLNFLLTAFVLAVFSSCKVSNRMFQTDEEYHTDSLQKKVDQAERNYIIQPNDYLSLQVFSSGGERIIDPDYELTKREQSVGKAFEPPRYLVKVDGTANLPMIGNIFLKGFNLYQADSILALEYSKYYKSPFVITRLLNKRVIVLGPATSMAGKVIPLENDNMNLIEVIAMYGGINENGKSYNIKLIRGNLKNPEVNIIDLSTIEGMKKANLAVYPNDIIYIEPRRRVFLESLREIAPVLSVVTNIVVALVVVFRK